MVIQTRGRDTNLQKTHHLSKAQTLGLGLHGAWQAPLATLRILTIYKTSFPIMQTLPMLHYRVFYTTLLIKYIILGIGVPSL